MSKQLERQFVSLRQEVRNRGGRSRAGTSVYVVTWTPTKRDRRRKVFTKLGPAEKEADRIEKLMRTGNIAAAEIPKPELAALIMLCKQIPGVPPHEIVRFYLEKHDPAWKVPEISIQDLGDAFSTTRQKDKFKPRHQDTVKSHMTRFLERFGKFQLSAMTDPTAIEAYLDNDIGGAGKTKLNHLITIRSFFNWLKNKRSLLPHDRPTVADQVETPEAAGTPKEVFSAEEMMRLLAASPRELLAWYVIGGFGGIREEERGRLLWRHWHEDEDNQIVCEEDVTKTKSRRCVPVPPNLHEWLTLLRGDPDERMEGFADPGKISHKYRAGVTWKQNGLRVSFASYHLRLYQNAPLTASIDGHTVTELLSTYKSIRGATAATAKEWFEITPQTVLVFVQEHKLPEPVWAKEANLCRKQK